MKPYVRPPLDAAQLAEVEGMEKDFERYSAAHPQWVDRNVASEGHPKVVFDEFVERLIKANYIVEKHGSHVYVKRP